MRSRRLTRALLAAAGSVALLVASSTPAAAGPVVGYIKITFNRTALMTQPNVQLFGVLADPLQWTCTQPATYPTATPFAVTCVPTNPIGTGATTPWKCDVLHADVWTTSVTGTAQSSMDCNGDGVPEIATKMAHGMPDQDRKFSPSAVAVTKFVCTASGPGGTAAVTDFVVACGDPGVPDLPL